MTTAWTAPAWVKQPPPAGMTLLEWRARIAGAEEVRAFGQWSWWIALTFREEVSERTAKAAFRWLLRQLAVRCFGDHFKFARVLDRQPDGRFHIHALIESPPGRFATLPDPKWVLALWESEARASFCTGLPGLNRAAYYVPAPTDDAIGYMCLRHANLEINWACTRTGPCARADGCQLHGRGWLD